MIDIIEENDNAIQKLVMMVSKAEYNRDTIIKNSVRMSFPFEFTPLNTTFETLKATGDIEIISDYDLKNGIVQIYQEYDEIKKSDQLYKEFVDDHILPFLWQNIDMINGKAVNDKFYRTVTFKNILTGYLLVLSRQRDAYKIGIEMIDRLRELISEKRLQTIL